MKYMINIMNLISRLPSGSSGSQLTNNFGNIFTNDINSAKVLSREWFSSKYRGWNIAHYGLLGEMPPKTYMFLELFEPRSINDIRFRIEMRFS
jgi:hypothetical protein